MTKSTKYLSRLGLGVAFLSATLLGCDRQEPPIEGALTHPPMAMEGTTSAHARAGEGENAEGGHTMEALPVEKRVAFMSGHVAAGLALYRAGAPDQAAPHLLHPVSETHASERAGIDALGFRPEVFHAVSEALEQRRPAASIEPMLAAAEANATLLRKNAGGDPADIIGYLMDTAAAEYQVGVADGAITNAGEYQDAYGFSVVALDIARGLPGDPAKQVVAELETLVALWPPSGPLAASMPTPTAHVDAQISKVRLALSGLRKQS
jgi:hypothetical protein